MAREYDYRFPYEKIKIPFNEREETVKWPDDHKIAAHIYVTLEWWGTISQETQRGEVDIGRLSERQEYTFDVGAWRILDLLNRYGVKATFLVSGAGAEHHPDLLEAIADQGHEIAAHGYYQSRPATAMDQEEEQRDIERTTEVLRKASGQRPVGWINPGAKCTEKTFEYLVNHDYLWHGDLRGDDLPYGIKVNGETLVEIPHRTLTSNDFAFFGGKDGIYSQIISLRSTDDASSFFRTVFDGFRKTAEREGSQSFTLGIHPFVSCLPDRIWAINDMISYLNNSPDVLVAPYRDIAEWWKDQYL